MERGKCSAYYSSEIALSLPFVWTGEHLNLVWINLCSCSLGKVDTCQPSIIAASWHLRGERTIKAQKMLSLPYSSDSCHPPEYLNVADVDHVGYIWGRHFLQYSEPSWDKLLWQECNVLLINLRIWYSLENVMLAIFANFSNSTIFMLLCTVLLAMGRVYSGKFSALYKSKQPPSDYLLYRLGSFVKSVEVFLLCFLQSRFCGKALEGQQETKLSWNCLMETSTNTTKYIKAQNLLSLRWTIGWLLQWGLLCLHLAYLHVTGYIEVIRISFISYIVASIISLLTQSGNLWVFSMLWNNTKEWRNWDVFTKFAWEWTPLFLLPGILQRWVTAVSATL